MGGDVCNDLTIVDDLPPIAELSEILFAIA